MGWVQPPTFVDGQQVTGETWNQNVVDNLSWLNGASAVRLTNSADITAAASYGDTVVQFDTEALNTVADGHSPSSSNGQFTVGQPGLYSVTASVSFVPASVADKLIVRIMLNGVAQLAEVNLDNDSMIYLQPCLHVLLPLRAGDLLSVLVQQSNSIAETIDSDSEYSPLLTAVWVAGIFPVGGDDPDRIA